MKRVLSLIFAFLLFFTAVHAETAETFQAPEHTINSKNVKMYLLNTEISITLSLYFVDGVEDMPWVDLEVWAKALNYLQQDVYDDKNFELTFSSQGEKAWLTRENGYRMLADFEEGTLFFDDYNGFMHEPGDTVPLLDLISMTGFNANGQPELFQRDTYASFDRYGESVLLNLRDYEIGMIHVDDLYLVPLQTMGDFTLATNAKVDVFYNGNEAFIANDKNMGTHGNYTALGERYYSVQPTDRSAALADYGYNELCLVLDSFYGLKQPHEIDRFAPLLWQIGYDEPLSSENAQDADLAFYAFLDYFLNDGHTYFNSYSWMAGDQELAGMDGSAMVALDEQSRRYRAAREKLLGDYSPYQEVGNTAYITFDEFENAPAHAYYDALEGGDAPIDTIGLIIYAHSRIYRENSPIENVVIDLSANTGGSVNAAAFVISWFLGQAEISVKDTFTGAMSTGVYRADVNLDREFDEYDNCSEKNLYCLISPVSFSCANAVPAAFKASGRVTLLGRPSSGGSCTVQFLSTAWGTSFDISGSQRMSFLKNGSFYDIDQGVEPDFVLSRPESFYDRETLTNYINQLP